MLTAVFLAPLTLSDLYYPTKRQSASLPLEPGQDFVNTCLEPLRHSVKKAKLVHMRDIWGAHCGERLRPQPTTGPVDKPTDDSSLQPSNLPAEAIGIRGQRQSVQDLKF